MTKYEIEGILCESYPEKESDFIHHPIYDLIDENGLEPKKIAEFDNLDDARSELEKCPAAEALVSENNYSKAKAIVTIKCYRIKAIHYDDNGNELSVDFDYSKKEDIWRQY